MKHLNKEKIDIKDEEKLLMKVEKKNKGDIFFL